MDRLQQIEEMFLRLQKGQEELRISQAKTDAQLAKTDEKLKETTAILSNIGINLGMVAEEFFYYSLKDKKTLGNVKFDYVDFNVHARSKKTEGEFDIVMYNGDAIAIIEVKHKVHPQDLVKLKEKQIDTFKTLFPDYADYKYYLGIGGFSIPEEVANEAISNGIAVLRQKGNIMDVSESNLKVY